MFKKISGVAAAIATIGACTVVGVAPASAASNQCVNNVFRQGSQSACVGYIQAMLNYDDYEHLSVDNSFGPLTRAAVVSRQNIWRDNFQPSMQIDGVVGPQTWHAICVPQKGPATSSFFAAAHAAGCPGL